MNESIKQFLEFRKKFTKREWFELNRAVEAQLSKKAGSIISVVGKSTVEIMEPFLV